METNFWAILVMGIFSIVLGTFWYGTLFGKFWMKLMGVMDGNGKLKYSKEEMKKMQKESMPLYIIQFVLSFVSLWVLYHYVKSWSAGSGMYAALALWVGFVMPIQAGGILWDNMDSKMKFKKFLVMTFYQLVLMLVAGYIFFIW